MSAQAIPPEQVFFMWKLKWFEAKPDLKRLFRDRPELRDEFLLREEVADLSKMRRDTVRQAIKVGHLLADILKEAERLEAVRSANQKATATARSKQKKKRKKQRPPVEPKGPVRPGYNDRDMSKSHRPHRWDVLTPSTRVDAIPVAACNHATAVWEQQETGRPPSPPAVADGSPR